jgi:hypothetical protein
MKTLLLVLALTLGCFVQVTAQSEKSVATCKIGETAPSIGSWMWDVNARVEVYVRIPDFAEDEVPAVLTALRNWDASASENGSGVRFEYRGTVAEARTCLNCLTITRGETADKRHGAELHAFSKQQTQIIDHAWIVINPSYKKSKSLTSIVAHELGHSLGLLDCYTCARGSTAMSRFNTTIKLLQIKIADWSSGIQGPTACDAAQVKEAYKELRTVVRPSPTVASLKSVDEGEEPEADDTPIVVP